MDDVLRELLGESNENLIRLEQDTVELERAPGDTAVLNSSFRTVHTIKILAAIGANRQRAGG